MMSIHNNWLQHSIEATIGMMNTGNLPILVPAFSLGPIRKRLTRLIVGFNDAKVFTAAKFTVLMIPSRHFYLLSRKRILIIDSMQEIILKRVIEENDCTYRKWIGA